MEELDSGSRGSRPITAAIRIVHEAELLRVTPYVMDGFIYWTAQQTPADPFLVRLAAVKPELIQLLDGSLCRYCGDRMDWRSGDALAFGDGTAAHLTCADAVEVARPLAAGQRAANSAGARADEAEAMRHGGPLP